MKQLAVSCEQCVTPGEPQASLTDSQRERILKQKQEALHRRQMRQLLTHCSDRQGQIHQQQHSSCEQCVTPARSAAASATFDSSATPTKQLRMATEDVQSPIFDEEKKLDERKCLNVQQQRVLDLVAQGANVFFSGSAGVGKSFTTQMIVGTLKVKYGLKYSERVLVVAPTGLAAERVGGQTIHSASRVGVAKMVSDFGRMFSVRDKWIEYEHILLDEVSMLAAEFLDQWEATVREICYYYKKGSRFHNLYASSCEAREDDYKRVPFMGGIQLIVCGDLYQLPPIPQKLSLETRDLLIVENLPRAFLHEGKTAKEIFCNRGSAWEGRGWWAARFHFVELTQCYRQQDAVFIQILNRMREGLHTQQDIEFLNSKCCRPIQMQAGVGSLYLYPTNKEAAKLNTREQAALGHAPEAPFLAMDFVEVFKSGEYAHHHPVHVVAQAIREGCTFWNDCLAEQMLGLKIGTQVILLANVDPPSLVNGSLGMVDGWAGPLETLEAYKSHLDLNKDEAELCSLQAATDAEARVALDDLSSEPLKIDSNCWSEASLSRSELTDPPTMHARRAGLCRQMILKMWKRGTSLPVIQFRNGRRETIGPHLFEQELVGFGLPRRLQIPLKMAWALSIHKSQGMSIDAVTIDATLAFTHGQTYVAISRATSLEGLAFARPLQCKQIQINTAAEAFMAFARAIPSPGVFPQERPKQFSTWHEQPPLFTPHLFIN